MCTQHRRKNIDSFFFSSKAAHTHIKNNNFSSHLTHPISSFLFIIADACVFIACLVGGRVIVVLLDV